MTAPNSRNDVSHGGSTALCIAICGRLCPVDVVEEGLQVRSAKAAASP